MKSKEAFNVFVLHRVLDGKTLSFTDIDLTTLRHILSKIEFTFRTVDNALKGGTSPKTSACLTFDDGFSSDYNIVLPELEKVGAKATFFIVTDLIGKPGYMTKEQINSLSNAGMQIGSHSVSHPNFLKLNPEERRAELLESKQTLESIVNKEIAAFSFPFGFFNSESIQAAFSTGYSTCCTSDHGLSFKNQTIICRNSINANTSIRRVDNILRANLIQRVIWICEDRSKALMKKFMPKIYVYIRNVLSRY